jgi:ribonuclease P/MRP protein subunit RPP40
LKSSKCSCSKSSKTLGYLKRTLTYFDAEMVKNLYITFVRPHLEFAVPVLNPYQLDDIANMEAIQRRATKLAPEFQL